MPFKSREDRKRYDRTRYHETTKWRRDDRQAQKRAVHSEEDRKIAVGVRLPARLIGRIDRTLQESIATHRYPFRTRTQIFAYLLLKGFESMAGDEFIDEQLPYLRAIEGIDQWRLRRTEAQQALSRVTQEIGELLSIKAKDQAVQLFWHSLHSFEALPPNIWRDWMMLKLRRAFPTLEKLRPLGLKITTARKEAKGAKKTKRRKVAA